MPEMEWKESSSLYSYFSVSLFAAIITFLWFLEARRRQLQSNLAVSPSVSHIVNDIESLLFQRKSRQQLLSSSASVHQIRSARRKKGSTSRPPSSVPQDSRNSIDRPENSNSIDKESNVGIEPPVPKADSQLRDASFTTPPLSDEAAGDVVSGTLNGGEMAKASTSPGIEDAPPPLLGKNNSNIENFVSAEMMSGHSSLVEANGGSHRLTIGGSPSLTPPMPKPTLRAMTLKLKPTMAFMLVRKREVGSGTGTRDGGGSVSSASSTGSEQSSESDNTEIEASPKRKVVLVNTSSSGAAGENNRVKMQAAARLSSRNNSDIGKLLEAEILSGHSSLVEASGGSHRLTISGSPSLTPKMPTAQGKLRAMTLRLKPAVALMSLANVKEKNNLPSAGPVEVASKADGGGSSVSSVSSTGSGESSDSDDAEAGSSPLSRKIALANTLSRELSQSGAAAVVNNRVSVHDGAPLLDRNNSSFCQPLRAEIPSGRNSIGQVAGRLTIGGSTPLVVKMPPISPPRAVTFIIKPQMVPHTDNPFVRMRPSIAERPSIVESKPAATSVVTPYIEPVKQIKPAPIISEEVVSEKPEQQPLSREDSNASQLSNTSSTSTKSGDSSKSNSSSTSKMRTTPSGSNATRGGDLNRSASSAWVPQKKVPEGVCSYFAAVVFLHTISMITAAVLMSGKTLKDIHFMFPLSHLFLSRLLVLSDIWMHALPLVLLNQMSRRQDKLSPHADRVIYLRGFIKQHGWKIQCCFSTLYLTSVVVSIAGQQILSFQIWCATNALLAVVFSYTLYRSAYMARKVFQISRRSTRRKSQATGAVCNTDFYDLMIKKANSALLQVVLIASWCPMSICLIVFASYVQSTTIYLTFEGLGQLLLLWVSFGFRP